DWLKACKQESDPCKNGGYTQKDCSCACPLGTSGDKCENLDMNYNDALVQKFSPNTAIIKTSGAEVVSPGYPKQKGLGTLKYTHVMQAPECHKAVATFSDFQIDPRSTEKNCKDAYLEIRTDVSVVNGEIFCGEEIKNGTVFKSDKSELIFHFYDGDPQHKGYKAIFTTEAIPNCR
ncbi:protein SpAN, partial [Hyalella azteca]|uniref:Protein SpAN n=1 Tax=Hyalella azteca TaxID=294128 RepID=A0A8B7NXD6_HYAAZ